MRTGDYLWLQTGVSAAILLVVGVEAARGKGMFCRQGISLHATGMLAMFALVVLLLVGRSVWQALAGGRIGDALGRTSAATYLAALFLLALLASSRLAAFMDASHRRTLPCSKNPLRSRLTWLTAALFVVLLFPLAMISTRLMLLSSSSSTSIPREELAQVARLIAAPGSQPERPARYVSPDQVVCHVHHLPDDAGEVTVIAFQGTHTLEQWVDDFDVSSVQLDDCCRIHGGFARLFSSMWPTLRPFLQEQLKDRPDARLILAGHSMGGAMAQLLAYQFGAMEPPKRSIRLMLFGSPTAGDATFVNTVVSVLDDYANVVLPFDPIPFLADTTFPPFDRQVVVIPLRPNRLFRAAHISSTYADALEDAGSLREFIESCLFLAGLGMLLLGAVAVIIASPISRRRAAMYLAATLIVVWQLGLRLSSEGAGGYVLFAAGAVVLAAGTFARRRKVPPLPYKLPN